MILDLMSHWRDYNWPSERFNVGFYHLERLPQNSPEGRIEIDGDNVFCMVQNYETKPRDEQRYEAHRNYADIQILLQGEESILWAPQKELTVAEPYKPDAEMYALDKDPTDIVLKPGRFCVLFPQDAHAPCTIHVVKQKVRKAVVKIRL
ncbi:MAG: YhcH/YjgK/YiaL family protein [Candidatus Hydrogenedentes bacterium]|nr:YhcH/YjgK/YiaL family protein [Candidatus Hydrogenedentota bacterium]